MSESLARCFTDAVIACLPSADQGSSTEDRRRRLVAKVLGEGNATEPYAAHPSRVQLETYQREIADICGKNDRIALVNGGATKIKEYVFEAPKLPEIRGASALLDWVNEVGINELWHDHFPLPNTKRSDQHPYIIYASGGGFLAFAPAALGDTLATAVERCYTEHTLTANSVAVSATFSLLELRYGRLAFDKNSKLTYWADTFLEDWKRPDTRYQQALQDYYYAPLDQDISADADEAIQLRFYNRKTFGELVTLLATMTNYRRSERAAHGQVRSLPFYQLSPWDAKCDSSDVRPAVVQTQFGDEIAPREMSEASARKRYVGQIVKNDNTDATTWYRSTFPHWIAPATLHDRSWEHCWGEYISDDKHGHTPYAMFIKDPKNTSTFKTIEPPKDVGQISQASKPSRYVGVIYADGNNVGRLIATLQTPSQYHDVSAILSSVAKDAVFHALAAYLQPVEIPLTAREKQARRTTNNTVWMHPFEILSIGGDDLFVLVPGDTALNVAAAISTYFEATITAKLRELQGLKLPKDALAITSHPQRFAAATPLSNQNHTPSIGLSAGVIVAQENAPIFFLRDLVEELLKSAKELAKENAKQHFYGGAVDFMVMKSITMVTDKIKPFRRQALGADSDRRLTARPYTWHEFAGLLDTVRQLKRAGVPRSQLYRLRRALDADAGAGITSSVMEYLYTRARMPPSDGAALQTAIEQPWCWSTPLAKRVGGLPPWMPLEQHRWETIWPDMLEVYEMVPEEVQP